MLDTLLRRYGNLDCIEQLEPEVALELIDKALLKAKEDRAFLLYANLYPYFKKDNFIPFSEFFKAQTQPISRRETKDILKEVEEIRKRARKEGE